MRLLDWNDVEADLQVGLGRPKGRPRRMPLAFLCCALLALLPGCAVKEPPPATDALKGVLPASTPVPVAWKESSTAGAVTTDWIQTFADPQLAALVDESLRNNLDLRVAASRVDVAAGFVVQARSLLFPQLAAVSGVGLVGRDTTKDRSGLFGEISWELDLWGRVRADRASAAAALQATEADYLYARQSLAAMVATLWYDTIATERLRETAQEATVVYDELTRLTKVRHRVGKVSLQNVSLAGADLDRARTREREFATSKQQIARGLELIVGRYPAAELALTPDLPPLPGRVPDGLPSELLERRPDLVAAERRVASAFHYIQVAQAARLPRIALTAGGGRSTSELLRLAGVGAGFWTVGLNMLAPLFTGGALDAEVKIATAEQQTAVAMYGQAALRAFSEVETSLASEGLLADRQQYLERVLMQDTEALRLGRLRYDMGATDLLDVLQLQAKQLDSQFGLISIRNDRLANRVALHLALGGGFSPAATP
jgi:NodT family efflux transporter outer membrane factor (OMF) lipoprotein